MERGVSKGPVAPARSGERHPRTGPSLGAEAPRDPPPPGRPPGLIPAAPLLPAPQSALGEMPPLAPAPHPSSITPGFGPRDPAAPGGGRTGGPERRIPGGARAEPVGHTGEVGAMGKGRGGRRGIRPRCVLPVEGSPRSFERVPKRVCARDRWDASGNGRDVTAKLKKEADVPLRGRVFRREHLPPPSRTKQKAQTKSEGSS